jgi:nucleotide-binding universal stress UspA family protein
MKELLYCTDGSSYAAQARSYASWVAGRAEARIHALYVSDLRRFEMPAVMDLSGSIGVQPYQNLISTLQESEKEKARLIEASDREALAEDGREESYKFETKTGFLVDTIVEAAAPRDLVVLGKRGESAEHAIEHLGSTLERVIRSVDKPCLVTNRRFAAPENLAVAYDGSKTGEKLLAWLEEATWLHDLPLHLLLVSEERDGDERAVQQLRSAEERLQAAGFSVRPQMLAGLAEDVIADYVDREGIGLLAIGAYGHGRLRRFLIGSTTSELIRRCRIPILCQP